MSQFIPHTPPETAKMLEDLGLSDIDQIFSTVPEALRLRRPLELPTLESEYDVIDEFVALGAKNGHQGAPLISFAGGGSYDHDIPSVVRALGNRSEFVTAYTPYQPEVAQGILQVLFEFQTLISRLSGLEISNASLYDGATALVEAVNLACAATRRSAVLVSDAVNPRYLETLRTFARGTGVQIDTFSVDASLTSAGALADREPDSKYAAVVVANPNYFGAYEKTGIARSYADECGSLLILCYDPISPALMSTPGAQGADVAVTEGQPLGIGLSFGGPYLGLFSVKPKYLRLVPGRLVGTTTDHEGRLGYVTTLRTREQDIRREKASSNVCTNQTLMAVQATIYLSWLGKVGFQELAQRCIDNSHYLAGQLSEIPGIELLTPSFFREFTIKVSGSVDGLMEHLGNHGILGGVKGSDVLPPDLRDHTLVITATERRSQTEMDRYRDLVSQYMETMKAERV